MFGLDMSLLSEIRQKKETLKYKIIA